MAAETVVRELGDRGGSGGLIAIDAAGRVALPFNSQGMCRGWIDQEGVAETGIDREPLTPWP